MQFLYFLEKLRNPVFDAFFSLVTHLGEETLFMVIALLFFWCINKKHGYYLLFTGFIGTVANQMLKMIFRIPRPWVIDPDFSIVESARAEATGYSFPSGHTQISMTTYGGIARAHKNGRIRWIGIAAAALVALSRMYLGVHTPKDVLVSVAIGLVLIFCLYPIVERAFVEPKCMFILIGGIFAFTLANLLFIELYPFPADVDLNNFANAQKTAWQFLFLVLALGVVYPLDHYLIKFETKAVWWAQIIKFAGGLAIVLAIRILLKAPFNALFGVNVGSGLRYFIMVVAAGALWPLTFRYFAKLGRK